LGASRPGIQARRAGLAFATAAPVVLTDGFATVRMAEMVAVTATTNLRSQAVMRRIGMTFDPAENFNDSDVKEGPLRRQVLYRERWCTVGPDAR
jgi:RimJ/RimL family protein N-acetyltransferase